MRTTPIITLFAAAIVCVSAQYTAFAKPVPPVVAKADQHLWPDRINTPESFDRASRAMLLVYVTTLAQVQSMPERDLQRTLQIEKVDRPSVDKWFAATWSASQHNYEFAASSCPPPTANADAAGSDASGTSPPSAPDTAQPPGQSAPPSDTAATPPAPPPDWTCGATPTTSIALRDSATHLLANIPSSLAAWQTAMSEFSLAYITEQLKLAAVFSRDNSEVDTLNSNEWNGNQLADRQFYLTFDDGPTAPHGNTDATLKVLSDAKKSATFFLVGVNLRARLDKAGAEEVKSLYGQQCVASDGWELRSHERWDDWQDSVRLTQATVKGTFDSPNVLRLFRPPYGQRRPDSESFFKAQSLHVALWNIDSLDWIRQMEANDIDNRVVALMLLKRHGVIMFDDIHPKAKTLLPNLFQEIGTAVHWGNCHDLGRL